MIKVTITTACVILSFNVCSAPAPTNAQLYQMIVDLKATHEVEVLKRELAESKAREAELQVKLLQKSQAGSLSLAANGRLPETMQVSEKMPDNKPVKQAGGFDGLFVQAGVGGSGAKARYSNPNDTYNDSYKYNQYDADVIGLFSVGYSKSFGKLNGAVNWFYILGDQRLGSKTAVDPFYTSTESIKVSNTWGFSFEPGWNFSESTLAYLKLAYIGAERVTGNWYSYDFSYGITGSGSHTTKETFNGFGYGAGIKHAFTRHFYGLAEIQQNEFDTHNKYTDLTRLIGTVGVGYKF